MRANELRPNGLMFVSVMVMNEPEPKPYQKKLIEFYGRIAKTLLPDVLKKHGIKTGDEIIASCMKTSAFAFPSHYL